MRSRLLLFTLAFYLAFAVSCSKQPPADPSADSNASDANAPASAEKGSGREAKEHREHKAEARKLVVPAGTAITVSLGNADLRFGRTQ